MNPDITVGVFYFRSVSKKYKNIIVILHKGQYHRYPHISPLSPTFFDCNTTSPNSGYKSIYI